MIAYFKKRQVLGNIKALKDLDQRIAENLALQETIKQRELDVISDLKKLLLDVDTLERKIAREIINEG